MRETSTAKTVSRLGWLALAALALATTLAAQAPAPQKPSSGGNNNPFPEDTTNVPVMPNSAAGLDAATSDNDAPAATVELPAAETDPVRSPETEPAVDDSVPASGFSSSRSGIDSVLPDPNAPDAKEKGRRGRDKRRPEPPPHVETAKDDITIARYYLDNKNWRAALSRYQSAMVLAPEEPEVYWGMAECQRHMGDLAAARQNYLKLVDYDPDSRHGKEAAKILKSPEMKEK